MENKKIIFLIVAAVSFVLIIVGLLWVAMNFQKPKTDENLQKTMESAAVTDEEAVQIVKNLPEVKDYEALLAQSDKVAIIEAEDNDTEWNVHVYEIVVQEGVSHTATFGWYQVDKKTGKVTSENSFVPSEDTADLSIPRPFADVYPENENFTAIKYLSKEGVVAGDESGNFNPKQVISRAEWAEMLVKLVGANPVVANYHDCFIDVKKESFAPAVCYAKEQGWMSAAAGPVSAGKSLELIAMAHAQEPASGRFAPGEPLKDIYAVNSLAKATNWDVVKPEQAVSEDVQNMNFAKQADIYKPQNADGTISREQAAGMMYRSVATVSFAQEKYDSKNDEAVAQNRLSDLIDDYAKSEQESFSRRRQSYINYYTEDFGKEKAAELVDKSGSEDELRKNVRSFRFERIVESEKAAGKEAKSFNAFRPIQSVFAGKGRTISIDDADIYKSDPANDYAQSKVSDPTFKPRESSSISIYLDDQYRVISKSDFNSVKIAYMVNLDTISFYGEGWTNDARGVGFVTVEIIDFNTGVIIAGGQSKRSVMTEANLINMYKTAVGDIERRIGAEIMPPPSSREKSGYIPIVPPELSNTASGSASQQPPVNSGQSNGGAGTQATDDEQLADESEDIVQEDEIPDSSVPNNSSSSGGGSSPNVLWTVPR